MKLGITCVYYFEAADSWVLDVQLSFIAKYTAGYDMTLYAAANRLPADLKAKLAACPFVKLLDLPVFDGKGGPEHGFYLDKAVEAAVADGCTHICTLDCDSFPMSENWPDRLVSVLGEHRLAAVFREENLDVCLPHPCGYFMTAAFAREIEAHFFPDDALKNSAPFQAFLAETGQRFDTGIGYAFRLWQTGEHWVHLKRSNRRDLHFLMAGIYGDVFFHMGASSRAPTFSRDFETRKHLTFTRKLKTKPILWRLAKWIQQNYVRGNMEVNAKMRGGLQSNPEAFIQSLR